MAQAGGKVEVLTSLQDVLAARAKRAAATPIFEAVGGEGGRPVEEVRVDARPHPEGFGSHHTEDLVTAPLAPSAAFLNFVGKSFVPSTNDYSDSIAQFTINDAKPALRPPKPDKVVVTPLHDHERLVQEVKSFREDIEEAKKQPDRFSAGLLETMQGIADSLEASLKDPTLIKAVKPDFGLERQAELSKALQAQIASVSQPPPAASSSSSSSTAAQTATYEVLHSREQSTLLQLSKLTELEARASALEKVIGSNSVNVPNQAVTTVLQQIEQKVALMNPATLDCLYRRLQSVVQQLDQYQQRTEARPAAATAQRERDVAALLSLIQRWDPTAQQLPDLCTRLMALAELHEKTAVLFRSISRTDEEQKSMLAATASQRAMLQKLTASVEQNQQTIQGNVQFLRGRAAALKEKIAKLKSMK